MPVAARLGIVIVAFLGVCCLVGAWAIGYLRTSPPTVAARVVHNSSGTQAYLTLQTVGSIGTGPRPTWVSYLAKGASGKWVHTTIYQLPAHATVHVTLYEYDSAGPLRNPEWSKIRGTIGGKVSYSGYVGSRHYSKPVSLASIGATDAAHTFSVPALGVNVPLAGLPSSVTNLCGVAPCHQSAPHDVVRFSFHTGGAHTYHWQCFIPCGLGFVDGNGGPMQTVGYMSGFLEVH